MSARIGDLLLAHLQEGDQPRWIAIGIQGYSIPWQTLYLDPAPGGAPVDPNLFLGLSHVIEEVMMGDKGPDPAISYGSKLSVGLHLDDRIDEQQRLGIVAEQRDFWARARTQTGAISLTRRNADSVASSLGSRSPHHVLYFLCHAGVPQQPGGDPLPDLAWFRLPDSTGASADITYQRLTGDRDLSAPLKNGPFVFINACDSAELSPQFYANFATYFLARGARAVLGTECQMATVFAGAFADALFERLLSGHTLGDAVLDTRRVLWKRGNALGLAYGLHGKAATHFAPRVLS